MDFIKKIVCCISIFLFIQSTHANNITWQPLNEGFNAARVQFFAINPANNESVLAATIRGGLYESLNHGAAWHQIDNHFFDGKLIMRLIINPKISREIYVAALGNGLYKSIDAGRTWQTINNGLTSSYITLLAMHPQNPQELYAAKKNTLFKTINGGKEWLQINMPLVSNEFSPTYLAINPLNPNIMILFGSDTQNRYLFRTVNQGMSWESLPNISQDIYQLDYRPNSNNLYVATSNGLFQSVNNGSSWTNIGPANLKKGVGAFVVDTKQVSEIFATSIDETGVFKSSNDGKTWARIYQSNLSDYFPYRLFVNPDNSKELFLNVHYLGVLHSNDGGMNWQVSNDGFSNVIVNKLVVDPRNDLRMYAATDHGLWLTNDGKQWQISDAQFSLNNISGIVIDPAHPNTLIMSLSSTDVKHESLIYRSTDGGQTWLPSKFDKMPYTTTCLSINPNNPNQLFTCDYATEVYKSEDNGINWMKQNNISQKFVITFNPLNSAEIFAGGFDGLSKTADGGKTWTHVNYNFKLTVLSIAIDPINPKNMYVGIAGGEMFYKSNDGGFSWRASNQGLPLNQYLHVHSILIDPTNSQTLYATTGDLDLIANGQGVYVSLDGGDHWSAANTGLHNLLAVTLTSNHAGKLFVGTIGSGVYKTV